MAAREIKIELDGPMFKEMALEAFEKGARIAIQRMTELAEDDVERAIVARLGAGCLAELEE